MTYFNRASLRSERLPVSRNALTTAPATSTTSSEEQKAIRLAIAANVFLFAGVIPCPPPT